MYFSSLGVWGTKFTNPKLGDRPQLWPALPPVICDGDFHQKSSSQMFHSILNTFTLKPFFSLKYFFLIHQACCLMLFN